MNQQVTPEAFYDTLSLGHKLDAYLDGFKFEEIHLFSFFSSFLFHYAGNPIGSWQHRYIVSNGYPFSTSLNEAILRHFQNGLFEEKGEFYSITSKGSDEFNKFKSLSTFSLRENYLNAACTTTIILPYSQTLRALLNEPELKKVSQLKNNDWLDLVNIYPEFEKISQAVGINTKDLMIPAVTWVNYLYEKETQNS